MAAYKSTTQKREIKFRRAKQLPPTDLAFPNMFDWRDRAALIAEIAYASVQSVFAWLSLEQIRNPPRRFMDAKLARQVAIHLLIGPLRVPQREVTRLQGRQRTSIHFAIQTVEKRLGHAVFAGAYAALAQAAQAHVYECFEGAE